MSASYRRCAHCRGFYELALSHCRYCGKDRPIKGPNGSPQVWPDRDTCRAVQIAEYEQLPEEAHKDCFRPDPEVLDKLCGCLHCGPEGGLFEAVEMRWMANEDMWACPCTTCGGRGFSFDIHLAEPLWQCAECKHWYSPQNGDFRSSNAKCPKCGSTFANGWFDDEDGEEEIDYSKEDDEFNSTAAELSEEEPQSITADETDPLPWEQDEEEDAFLPAPPEAEKMKDDIDFPHERRSQSDSPDSPLNDDDIPW